MRALGIDPVRDTQQIFRALLDAMARPGTIERTPTTPADHAVLATLVDHEVSLHTEDDAVCEAFAGAGRLVEAALPDADVVHIAGSTDGRVREAQHGSLKEPSDGATVVYRVDSIETEPTADDVAVTVSGPGVPGTRTFAIGGLPAAELEAIADAQRAFPRGIDVVLTTEDRLAALPRSIDLEVA
ncbi:phosphonate C-P lyase system protein PhnH [Natronorubrum aibiense]|uniref:Phosphonate C-P lyase system protein PhnH n=1 Tax=Natronorubrum aibiense TaxID=348826 RepID=A0A5P9PA01_9EURY|nr:phosphonate C-P lyase system protein PhnH [Natronorubrum aibiense]QFU84837.1 phosphonate C-P lyase system protein PhnH [Natronorubrum aibiense]